MINFVFKRLFDCCIDVDHLHDHGRVLGDDLISDELGIDRGQVDGEDQIPMIDTDDGQLEGAGKAWILVFSEINP